MDARAESVTARQPEQAAVARVTQAAWILFPAVAMVFLLAATGYVSENIMPVPLIWVLPLSGYLLSFILCFGRRGWYRPGVVVPLTVSALLAAASLVQFPWLGFHIALAIAAVTIVVFVVSTYCHGEVLQPAASNRRTQPVLSFHRARRLCWWCFGECGCPARSASSSRLPASPS